MLTKRLFEDIFDEIDDELIDVSADEMEMPAETSKYDMPEQYEHYIIMHVNGIKRSKKREVNIDRARNFVRVFRYYLENMMFVDTISDIIMTTSFDPGKESEKSGNEIKDLDGGLYVIASAISLQTYIFNTSELVFKVGINTCNSLYTPSQIGYFYMTFIKYTNTALCKSYGYNNAIFSYLYDKYTDSSNTKHTIYFSKGDYNFVKNKNLKQLSEFYRICRIYNP